MRSLNANGNNGQYEVNNGGSSGGGGAGEIWIDAGGTFLNQGGLDAIGGSGGNPSGTVDVGGAGSGGEFIAEASDIINDGTINVDDGTGASTNGGSVNLDAPSITENGSIVGVVPEPTMSLMVLPIACILLLSRRRAAGRKVLSD